MGLSRGAQAVVVVLALAVAIGVAAQAQAAPRSFYGVVPRTPLEPRDFERMSDGGVGTLRSTLSWAAIDPTEATDDYRWGTFDAIVAQAARNRITVLPFVFGTPGWVAEGLDRRRCGSRCELYAPRGEAARDAWRAFVGAAVDRYGRGGRFWAENPSLPKRPIRAWQIWNEQNSRSFYRPRPSTKGYAKLLDTAASAIKARDRRAHVVLGGMAELSGVREAVPGSNYLRNLYRRKGVRRQVEGFRDEIKRAGDRRASLWVTEIGWGAKAGGNPLNVGKRGQRRRLEQAFRHFERERRRMRIKTVNWFSWRDSPASICDWCASSGLLSKGAKPKPAWRAYRRVAR